jgi:hypothetical protein
MIALMVDSRRAEMLEQGLKRHVLKPDDQYERQGQKPNCPGKVTTKRLHDCVVVQANQQSILSTKSPKAKVVPEREILLKAPLSDERDDGPIRSPVGAREMESCADGTRRVHSDSERRWARKLGTDLDMNSCGAL